MPPRARPRRGAWWGSQQAKAFAAACLAAVLLTLAAAGPAAAYRCEEAAMTSREDCRVPRDESGGSPRKTKRGTMGSVTVVVLSVAGVLLIPIGARGLPSSIDPYRD